MVFRRPPFNTASNNLLLFSLVLLLLLFNKVTVDIEFNPGFFYHDDAERLKLLTDHL